MNTEARKSLADGLLKRVILRKARIAAGLACLLPLIAHAQFRLEQPQPVSPKLMKAGRILDVASGTYLSNQGILTEGDRIKDVGPWEKIKSEAPQNSTLIDLSSATILPGLIDAHSHLLVSMPPTSGGESIVAAVSLMSPEFRTGSELAMQGSIWKQE